ncbi:MAG: hypothetical protein ABSE82_06455 [Nitrososphaerales archaeon]
MAPPDTTNVKWYKTRTAISGLLLLVFAIAYIGIVAPSDNFTAPLNYRFAFSFETSIYVVVAGSLGIHWLYRLVVPASVEPRKTPVGRLDVLNMIFKSVFVVVIGGSYITGAATASPQLFAPIMSAPVIGPFVGLSVPIFADYLHTTFAGLIVAFGLAIIVLEILKIATGHGTVAEWLAKPRYREAKVTYWFMGVAVIIQGTLGMFLAGTFSSIGPYGFLGLNSYSFETLVRHIHGPFGAVVFMTLFASVYFRVRPEFSIR